MGKTLYELGEAYDEDIATLTAQIECWRERLKHSVGTEHIECGRRLACLYEMRRDTKMTADMLKHYYDNGTEKRAYHKKYTFKSNKERT